jgi:hypothetical protein
MDWFNVASFVIGTAIGVGGIVYGRLWAKHALRVATEDDDVRWEVSWPIGQAALAFTNAAKRDTAFGVVIDVRVGMDMDDEHRRVAVGFPLQPGKTFGIALPRTRQKMEAHTAAGEEMGGAATWRVEWRTRLGNRRVEDDGGIYPVVAPMVE